MQEGKVWRYGDNIDTDVIIPARYLNTFEPKELAAHCMEDIDTTFAKNVAAGDIIVGGRNFGCGERLSVDTATGEIRDLTTGDTFRAHPLPGFVQEIAAAGGLLNYIKENGGFRHGV